MGVMRMKRSSRVSLLISSFSLLAASTVGLGSSNASQAQLVNVKVRAKYVVPDGVRVNIPVTVINWDTKMQQFERTISNYSIKCHLRKKFDL